MKAKEGGLQPLTCFCSKWNCINMESHLNNWSRGSMFAKYFEFALMKNAARVKSKVCVWTFSPPLLTDMRNLHLT